MFPNVEPGFAVGTMVNLRPTLDSGNCLVQKSRNAPGDNPDLVPDSTE